MIMLRYLGALELDSVEVQVQLGDKKDIKDLVPKKVKLWHNWYDNQKNLCFDLLPAIYTGECVRFESWTPLLLLSIDYDNIPCFW